MDDTQQSRISDAAATATRKRRSSILKSQRPPRAPFSELEFNVTTPTDTAKSRRVSFSRRTGVAEFVTNEATTTWKNFYEEQNRTLESSGNDSEVKPPRPSVGHIGKRIFDQQFEEVEVDDFVSAVDDGRSRNIETSMNNINFAAQLESLECTGDDRKLSAPHQKFELSTFTDQQSKLFGDDLAISNMGEFSDQINVNFSAMQPLSGDRDDLDEIQRDLQQAQSNMCQEVVGPRDGRNLSEYIEVDLNMTQNVIRNDASDMSITDTIQSPKVQEVPKPNISIDKNSQLDKDWVADKENIIVNPYVAPKETDNFAINEEPDKVLYFDGKRLTIETEKPASNIIDFRKTLLPDIPPDQTPLRKTIVLNVDDDLPNFLDDPLASMSHCHVSRAVSMGNHTFSADLSMTQPVPNKLETNNEKRRTIVYENDMGNISVTQAVPTNIILSNKTDTDKRKTIVFEDDSGDMSVTQAITINNILADKSKQPKRKTIVFDDDAGNLSITQAISSDIFIQHKDDAPEKRRTIVFQADSGNISVTQAVLTNIIIPEKRNTIINESSTNEISVTHALCTELNEKRKTILFEPDLGDISMTQAVPANFLSEYMESPVRRKTLVYEDDASNISITQAVPKNIILSESDAKTDKRKTIVFDPDAGNISITQAVPSNLIFPEKDRSIQIQKPSIFQADIDLSIADIVPTRLTDNILSIADIVPTRLTDNIEARRKTIVYEDEAGNISITEAVPANILPGENTPKTIVYESDSGNISVTQSVSLNIILQKEIKTFNEIRKTLLETDSADISKTADILMPEITVKSSFYEGSNDIVMKETEEAGFNTTHKEQNMSITEVIPQKDMVKRNTIVFQDDAGNMSMTKPIPVNLIAINNEINNVIPKKDTDEIISSETQESATTDIFVYHASTENTSIQLSNRTEHGDSKSAEPINEKIEEKSISSSNVDEDNIIQSNTSPLEPIENHILKLNYDQNEVPSIASENISITEPQLEKTESDGSKTESKSKKSILSYDQKEAPFIASENISITDPQLEKMESDGSKAERKSKKSILCDLLDMSNASMEIDVESTEDKNIMAIVESDHSAKESSGKEVVSTSSGGSLFLIIRDSDVETQTDKTANNSNTTLELPQLEKQSMLQREIKGDVSLSDNHDISSSKIPEEVHSTKNELVDSFVSDVMGKEMTDPQSPVSAKSYGDANNTKELLKLLSNFTDKEEENNPLEPLEPDEDDVNDSDKEDISERYELGPSPKKESASCSRENSIVGHSILQKSFENINDADSGSPGEKSFGPKKFVRLSADVRKTLQFEDESTSDTSSKFERNKSPLRKTVFGETSYMKENKAKVPIPSYLKDVSDGIKQLMSDLVKPMADVLPFENGKVDKAVRKMTSTCSMQVQANLLASSQIDLDSDLHSKESLQLCSEVANTGNKAMSNVLKSSLKPPRAEDHIVPEENHILPEENHIKSEPDEIRHAPVEASIPGRVLVFDHSNPLNNVLLTPADLGVAHRYDPISSQENLILNKRNDSQTDERINNQYIVENLLTAHPQAGDSYLGKISEVQSYTSNMSKPLSTDRSVDALVSEVKNIEVNTLIVMKENKELLEASSSLTLVDDELPNEKLDVDLESTDDDLVAQSPVEVIYSVTKEDDTKPNKLNSDTTSNDDEQEIYTSRNTKRALSPKDKQKHRSDADITPKPLCKIQKLSNSPTIIEAIGIRQKSPDRATQTVSESSRSDLESPINSEKPNDDIKKPQRSPKKSPRKSKSSSPKDTKPARTITVQQMITEYHIETIIDQETLNNHILDAIKNKSSSANVQRSPEAVGSFASSKNRIETRHSSVTTSESRTSSARSKAFPMDWQPELINELSSKNLAVECESSVNVVAKIDMLPFMGSRECEWEASSGDMWSFRLLHGRLRLSVRLAHRHDNATRSCVRADTPVLAATFETTPQDKKNSVAMLCVSYAADAMRYFLSQGCARAGDVPALLRRAAGVARVALRWGRAMRDAWAHLAYTLTSDGYFSLKVANIPLRSVWEVTMQIKLVVDDDDHEVPWPRATHVTVHGVVTDVVVTDVEVRRVLGNVRRDWGNVPCTIWKIFKHLKHKTREDDLLLGAPV